MNCGKPRFLCKEIDSHRGAAATACPQPDHLLCHQACVGGVLPKDTPFLIFYLTGVGRLESTGWRKGLFSKLRGENSGHE
jgi:hypothetical protein